MTKFVDHKKIIELWNQGRSAESIVEILGLDISVRQVYRIGLKEGNQRRRLNARFDMGALEVQPEIMPSENSIQRLMAEKKYRQDARQLLYVAVRGGKIKPLSCEWPDGGHKGRVEAHHADYTLPYDVIWLCNRHHTDLHTIGPYVAPIPEYTEQ